MKLSQAGIGNIKLNVTDPMYPAQEILLQSGQITQFGTGIYAYNNVPLLLRRNVEKIITETLNKYGCIEILLPTLQQESMWKASGRYDKYVEETGDKTVTVIASTASPYKFAASVLPAVYDGEMPTTEFDMVEKLSSVTNTKIPKSLAELKTKQVLHKTCVEKQEMSDFIKKFLG